MIHNSPLYDTHLSTKERARWLVSQMSLEDKFEGFARGITVSALGISARTICGEGAHGVQARAGQHETYEPTPTTSFSQPIGMVSSFDTALIEKAGDVTGKESRAFGNAVNKDGGAMRLAPTVDLCRDPRWGRNEEGYGEDPYLTGKMASAYIRGMQDEHNYDGSPLQPGERGDRIRTAATLKHFYANNQEYRRCFDSFDVNDKVKYDYLLEPYRYCVTEGHAEAVMTSYNEINHLPAMLNHEVQDILKDKWGLHFAMTDGGDFLQTVNFHHYFETHAESLAEGVKAGVDAMLDTPDKVREAAKSAYERGLITEEEMDKSLLCTAETLIRMGFFDPEDPYADLDMADVGTDDAKRISLAMAQESTVLLKNEDGFLPLSPEEDLALIGPVGDSWYMDWYCGKPLYKVTLKDGLEKRMRRRIAFDNGLDQIVLKYDGHYLGASLPAPGGPPYADGPGAELVLVDRKEDAVIFEQTNWGEGSHFLYAPAYGKYLNVDENGTISLNCKDPYAWFVTASFTIGSAGAKVLAEPRSANSVELDAYWNDAPCDIQIYCFGKRSLRVEDGKPMTDPLIRAQEESNTKEGGNVAESWLGSPVAPSVLSVEIVSSGIERAKALAKAHKKVIMALGCNPVVNAKEEIDRRTIAMIPSQERLVEAVYEENPETCVVLITNYPYAIGWMKEHVPAILLGATGSQDMGHGFADAIFGRINPAARLPMTWYLSDADLPPMEDYDLIRHPRTYRYFERPVLYPFGYGLSYTSFAYEELQASQDETNGKLMAFVRIRNTGEVTGDEVVQLYIKRVSPSKTVHPKRRLIGFERLHSIKPGETATAEFTVNPEDLAIYIETEGRRVVEAGEYQIYAGRNSADEAVIRKIIL